MGILIDLVDDAAMIETAEEEGFIRIRTGHPAAEQDSVTFQAPGTGAKVIPAGPTAKTTSRAGAKVVEFFVSERDLPDPGAYVVRSWTRRGATREITFTVTSDETKLSLVIDPASTPIGWVANDEVFQGSRSEPLTIEVPLRLE